MRLFSLRIHNNIIEQYVIWIFIKYTSESGLIDVVRHKLHIFDVGNWLYSKYLYFLKSTGRLQNG